MNKQEEIDGDQTPMDLIKLTAMQNCCVKKGRRPHVARVIDEAFALASKEGHTPTDVAVLRQANLELAAENASLREKLESYNNAQN